MTNNQEPFLLPTMLVSICLFLLVQTATANGSNDTDKQALLEFKSRITDDPLEALTTWNNSFHICKWNGVTCGRKHQRVTGLYLHSNKLGGSVSPHLGNLSFLKVLDLSNNSFRSSIPQQLGRLRRLRVLYLSNNSLSGEIPSNLSHCSFLFYLDFRGNNLIGNIPAEIGQLNKLESFSIAQNNLTGPIPSSFGNLSSIREVSASLNGLSGNVLETLVQLKGITKIGLSGNRFTGTIPSSISNLNSIQVFDIGSNQFRGNIPPGIFTSLKNLYFLALSDNQFTGTIPSSVSNASSISILQLGANHLEGQVPNLQSLTSLSGLNLGINNLGRRDPDDLNFLCSLTNATSLRVLTLGSNNFGGTIPQCIGNLSSTINYLSFYDNRIHGSIPAGFGNLTNLWGMDMSKNKLSGNIPETIGNLQFLNVLYVNHNSLSGPIPRILGSLSNLYELDVSDNSFEGVIPPSLGKCLNLQELELSRNNLNGILPLELMSLSSLTYFGFSQNHLTGPLPEEIGNLASLQQLPAYENMFSGEIPRGLGKCSSLERISLKGNHFQGSIPSSLSSLRGLQVLVLSRNNLSGKIPEYLASFVFLTVLDLAFNEFEGMVPTQGVFKNANATSLEGNKMLCGGIPEFHLRACNYPSHKHTDKKRKKKIIIASVSAILGVSLVWLLVFLLQDRKKKEERASSNSGNLILNVPYHDLYRATNGFSTENLIGAGIFGSVYKGIVNEDQKLIAVKVINLVYHGAAKSFLAECEALRNTRHRNLVKVLSVCSSIDHQGHNFKALVYEFMENGCLEEWLHPPPQGDADHSVQRNLSLRQRVNIAIDVASALEYLHFECGTPLVHCDIKPSNVLLDDGLVAHVSDFGIAKFLSRESPSTNNSSSLGLRGTIGYAPPEYGLGSNVSTKGDAYSYGILLLEMFTGKRPTNETFRDGWSLHELAKRSSSVGTISEVIDPVILEEIGETEATRTSIMEVRRSVASNRSRAMECLTSIIDVGVACSSESPEGRMNTSEVTRRLHTIRSKLLQQRS